MSINVITSIILTNKKKPISKPPLPHTHHNSKENLGGSKWFNPHKLGSSTVQYSPDHYSQERRGTFIEKADQGPLGCRDFWIPSIDTFIVTNEANLGATIRIIELQIQIQWRNP
ncbi:hypothetical protein GWI33_012741 [Rhynchophorus ferrugineus]|uniref:Uncharacterized protein n=1 Tax=Rhynchophorus ferrugineus TaxID=354439 RepID=A0A834IRC5_RHYFE|nr:hypothetical protein GWI33_012741 [Rhynchophorus ferrugineus]